jgi:predicted DNA-binding transcriptional regulator YafY
MARRMPRGDQLSRQWRLLQMIDRLQGVTVDDAARDLECTIRTIWRDLDTLQKASFPLYTERAADGNRGIWRVTEDFKRALPLKLTLGELAALLMSRHLLSPLSLSVLGAEVASAFDKIQNVLSRDALKVLDQIRDRLGVRPAGAKLQGPRRRAPAEDPPGPGRTPCARATTPPAATARTRGRSTPTTSPSTTADSM